VLHSQTNPAGSAHVVTGDPPFALVIGNAEHVKLTFNGQAVDLAPYTRGSIARLTLQ
jgi:cytoskeleton protein RodZ